MANNVNVYLQNFIEENVRQLGYHTPIITPRDIRSYTAQRETQLMRHIATMIFLYLSKYYHNITEVQCMWVNNTSLFIGENNQSSVAALSLLLSNKTGLYNALVSRYGRSGDLFDLSVRFSEKIKRFSANNFPAWLNKNNDPIDIHSKQTALKIYNLLMSKQPIILDVSQFNPRDFAAFNIPGIYIVSQSTDRSGRHIEEKFIDLLELGRTHWRSAVIAGRMRPCATCYGRITSFAQRNLHHQLIYNDYPGNIWKGRLLAQPIHQQAETMRLVGNSPDQKQTFRSKTRKAKLSTKCSSDSDSDA